jgi:hypothetical protein
MKGKDYAEIWRKLDQTPSMKKLQLTSTQHMRLARANHRAAADAKLSLEEKRLLQYNARRHEALAKMARKQENQRPDGSPPKPRTPANNR